MKDIKEVRQALEIIGNNTTDRGYFGNYVRVLDQFITDTENLIKENEELKEERQELIEINARYLAFNTLAKKELKTKSKSLHDNQAIEPSVLEKIDKLERENAFQSAYINDLQREEQKLDKALDKVLYRFLAFRNEIKDGGRPVCDMFGVPKNEKCTGICCYGSLSEVRGTQVKCIKDHLLKEVNKED